MTPEQELSYLQEQRQSLMARLETARAAAPGPVAPIAEVSGPVSATWGPAPAVSDYPGSSEVTLVDADQMRRQAEMATIVPAPPGESVQLLEQKLAACDLLIADASRRAQELAGLEHREESELEKLVGDADDLAGQLGEYKEDLKDLQHGPPASDLSGHTQTVGIPDLAAEHAHAEAPAADPLTSAAIAVGAVAHVGYQAYEANKDAIADKVAETLAPHQTEVLTELAERHVDEQARLDQHLQEAREAHPADRETGPAEQQALVVAEQQLRAELAARQQAELIQAQQRLAIEQPQFRV